MPITVKPTIPHISVRTSTVYIQIFSDVCWEEKQEFWQAKDQSIQPACLENLPRCALGKFRYIGFTSSEENQ